MGSGEFGSVWRGVHLPSGRSVAVKVLESQREDGVARMLFQRELALLARLDHAHIVRLHDVVRCDERLARRTDGRVPAGSAALVMDWCEAGSLAAVDRRLEWGTIRGICMQILDALGHAHARGILHLDVKPSNVLVASRVGWTVALGDFGVSLLQADEMDGRPFHAGTKGFMAPEQARRSGWELQPHTDVYGVGRTLQWLLARHDPQVPDHTEELVERLVAPDPADRFPSAARAMAALRALGGARRRWSDVAPSSGTETVGPEAFGEPFPSAGVPISSEVPTTMAVAPEWVAAVGDTRAAHRDSALRAKVAWPPFVGRQDLQDLLWEALGRVRATEATERIWLRGAVGMGRSRLAAELVARCTETGLARAMTVRLDPLRPLHDLLGEALARWMGLPSGTLEERVLRAHQIGRQLGLARSLDDLLDLMVGQARGAAAAQCLVEVVADRGDEKWLVVLDDADQHSQAGVVLDGLSCLSATLLVAIGEGPAPEGWREIEVAPLTQSAMRTLAARLLPQHPDLQRRLVDRGGGSPLAFIERLRLWHTDGSLRATGESWSPTLAREIPLWEERVTQLSLTAEEQRVLSAAAVLGRRFELAPLVEMSEHAESAVHKLASGHLVEPDDTGAWGWGHPSLRDWALERADPAVAGWLASWAERSEQPLRVRARLLEHAGDWRAALSVWMSVAEAARRSEDERSALEALGEAERIGASLPSADPSHLDRMVLRGMLYEALGDHHRGAEQRQTILAASQAHGWARGPVYASWLEARSAMYAGDRAEALRILTTLDDQARALGDPLLMARVAFDRGRSTVSSGDPASGARLLEEALARYMALDYRNGIQVVAPYLGYALLEGGRDQEAMAVLDRTERWASEPEANEARALRAHLRAHVHKIRGEHALEEKALREEREAQPYRRRWLGRLNMALCRLHQEPTEERLLEAQAAIVELESRRAVLHARIGHALLLPFLAALDRPEAFTRHLTVAEELLEVPYTSRELVAGLTDAREAVQARGWTPLLVRVSSLRDTVEERRSA